MGLLRKHGLTAQMETQASLGQEGTQAWLVGAAWDLVRYPFGKTRSAYYRDSYKQRETGTWGFRGA